MTLRLILIENLRRMAETIVRARRLRREADQVADALLGVGDQTRRRKPIGSRPLRLRRAAAAVCRAAAPASPRPRSRHHPRSHLAAGSPGRRRHQSRRRRQRDPSAAGGLQRHGSQHRHQPAPHQLLRLGGIRRRGEPGRPAAHGGERVQRDELRHPGPLPPQHRRAVESIPARPNSTLPTPPSSWRMPSWPIAASATPVTSCSARAGASSETTIGFRPPAGLRFSRFVRRHATGRLCRLDRAVTGLALALPL